VLDGASKGTLDSEFGTSNEDECIAKILEAGSLKQGEVSVPSILSVKFAADLVK
jgi:ribosome maturation protein Sdo1